MIAVSIVNFNHVKLKENFPMISKKFGIIGGDMRQYHLAKSLKKDGHKIQITGFENYKTATDFIVNHTISDISENSDYIILPLPISHDGINVISPFSEKKINLDLIKNFENKKIFGGSIPDKLNLKTSTNSKFYDFYREDLMILNAVPTAEGAVIEAFKNLDKTIGSSKCLVTGYGRIGKILCNLLKNMGAKVTATMRSSKDFAWTQTQNIKSTTFENSVAEYDVIFNTIPTIIFDYNYLKKISKSTIIIDLASKPGGIDRISAEKLGIKVIHALGLPGKYFPKTAGEIIKTVIYKIIEEENL